MTPTDSSAKIGDSMLAAGPPELLLDRVLCGLAFGSAASILFSIAVSQILLGLSLLGLIFVRRKLSFPPILLPLSLFFLATVVADLLSPDPWKGFPQIRKFFVFGIVLAIFNTFHNVSQVRKLIWAWTGIATLSGIFALSQFVHRWLEAKQLHVRFYDYVLDGRITGFASHWMTFGGEQMIVLLLLLPVLLFESRGWWTLLLCIPAAIIWLAIVLGLTRSIFLVGVPVGVLVLLWIRRDWLTLSAPIFALAILLLAPRLVEERIVSVVYPHGEVDSNSRRSIMVRTGIRMIRANPVWGIGLEQVQERFTEYLPPDVRTPLPKGWYGHLHNIYLQYAAERGVPALLFLLWMIGKACRDFRQAIIAFPKSTLSRPIWLGALAVTAGVLSEGLFEHNLGDSEILTLFVATITCGYVAIRNPEQA